MQRTRLFLLTLSVVGGLGLAACGGSSDDSAETTTQSEEAQDDSGDTAEDEPATTPASLSLSTDAFDDGAAIPSEYTCDGDNLRPQFAIEGTPQDAIELVLIVDDPDAPNGSFIHWVAWGIPPDADIPGDSLPEGTEEGTNDTDSTGWFGPCPPPGAPHAYEFQLSAVSESPNVAPGATAEEVRSAIAETTVAEALLVGTYERT